MLDDRFKELVYEGSRYKLPCRRRAFEKRPRIKRELFALGSAMYEIIAWTRLYKGLEDEEIQARYSREEFPSLDGKVGSIILGCWKEAYATADEVVKELREAASIDQDNESQHQ